MPKSFRHLVQALACLALLASASLQAQESRLDRILESGVLRVATTGDYKPFSYRTEEGGYAGFDVDMAQRLAESLGAKLVVVPTSWPNLMRDFADDRFDIAMSGISINLERQRQAYFSIPYLRDGKTPITICSEEARFQTLEQIDQPGVTAIVSPGGTSEVRPGEPEEGPDPGASGQRDDLPADRRRQGRPDDDRRHRARLQSRLHRNSAPCIRSNPSTSPRRPTCCRATRPSSATSTSGCTSPSRAACCASAWSTGSNTAGPPRTASNTGAARVAAGPRGLPWRRQKRYGRRPILVPGPCVIYCSSPSSGRSPST